MSSYNQVTLIGNLGQDPELKTLPSGSRVCNFSIATTETWKNKDGSKGEETTWHDIEIWDKKADAFYQFTKKGAKVLIVGKIKKNKNEETGVWYTRIKADSFEWMDSKGSKSDDSAPASSQDSEIPESDIPF